MYRTYKNPLKITNITLPLPINKIIKNFLVCTEYCFFFQYNDIFYKQKIGLPLCSPLIRDRACLFVEFLEFLESLNS